jgi:N-acetylmuramoyl-L-alanine amidase
MNPTSVKWTLLLVALLISGCAVSPGRSPLAQWVPSPNFNVRQAQLIVLHHTSMKSFDESLDTLRSANAHGQVSAHYLIAADGRLVQLVDDQARAWHAGVSRWNGLTDLNSSSIGIELDNDGASPFAPAQIATLIELLGDICTRRKIDPRQVWAHGDVTPGRKADPSRFFPWAALAQAGFGLWPRSPMAPVPAGFDPWAALRAIGYDLSNRPAAVSAYRRHYRADDAVELDARDLEILADLLAQLKE